MTYIIIISYIVIIFLVYTILRFMKTYEDPDLHAMFATFWPVIVVTIIIAGPFYLIDAFVKKIKRNKKESNRET